jgi:hypothetical protein
MFGNPAGDIVGTAGGIIVDLVDIFSGNAGARIDAEKQASAAAVEKAKTDAFTAQTLGATQTALAATNLEAQRVQGESLKQVGLYALIGILGAGGLFVAYKAFS